MFARAADCIISDASLIGRRGLSRPRFPVVFFSGVFTIVSSPARFFQPERAAGHGNRPEAAADLPGHRSTPMQTARERPVQSPGTMANYGNDQAGGRQPVRPTYRTTVWPCRARRGEKPIQYITGECQWIYRCCCCPARLPAPSPGLLGIGGGIDHRAPIVTLLFESHGVPHAIAIKMALGTSLATIVVTAISSIYNPPSQGAVDWAAVPCHGTGGVRRLADRCLAGLTSSPATPCTSPSSFPVRHLDCRWR